MTKFAEVVADREPRSLMKTREDAELLEEIALRQSGAAFEELYARYAKRAYNLAHFLVENRELAEDAVQDALLGLWQSASSYRRELGTAESWIMRLVANKSLNLARTRKRYKTKMKNGESREPIASSPMPSEQAERQEMLLTLRRMLEGLPVLDRHLVALYYGGGLSHDEIAVDLEMSRSSVTHRLQKALEALRGHLSKAGFAAAVPLLSAAGLKAALTSGLQLSPSLRARVLDGLAQAARGSLRASRRVAVKGAWSQGVYLPAGLTVFAAASLGLWWAAGSKPLANPTPEAVPPVTPIVTPSPPPQMPVKAKHIYQRWSFEQGPAADLKASQGKWHWVPARDGRPAGMEVAADDTLVVLPVTIPEGTCLEVTLLSVFMPTVMGGLKGGVKGQKGGHMGANWNVVDRKNYSLWGKPFVGLKPNTHMCLRTYLTEDREIATYWELPARFLDVRAPPNLSTTDSAGWISPARFLNVRALVFKDPVKRDPRVFLSVNSVLIREIEIRGITREEIPERFRDPKRLVMEHRLELMDEQHDLPKPGAEPDTRKTE